MKYLKFAILLGLPSGILYAIWFWSVYYFGGNPFYSFGQKLVIMLQLFVTVGSIYFYRKKNNQGILSFAEGVWLGFLVTCISALLSSTIIYLYLTFIEPNLVTYQIDQLQAYLIANKDQLIKSSDKFTFELNFKETKNITSFTLMLDDFIWKIIKGLMFTFLTSIALRRAIN